MLELRIFMCYAPFVTNTMISAVEFKKQISKTLGDKMRAIGFRGSGFDYLMESDAFVFAFGIQASRYGGQCCAEYGIQPKEIESIGEYKLNFKKLRFSSCELRSRLAKPGKGDQWWTYSDKEEENKQIANQIFDLFISQALPTIDAFKSDPNIMDRIEVSDLENPYINVSNKLEGISPMFGDIRFAWALTKVYELKNPDKSKQFAKYGLSKLDSDSTFFGKIDFQKVIAKETGA